MARSPQRRAPPSTTDTLTGIHGHDRRSDPANQAETTATIRRGLDLGISLLDTAHFSGLSFEGRERIA